MSLKQLLTGVAIAVGVVVLIFLIVGAFFLGPFHFGNIVVGCTSRSASYIQFFSISTQPELKYYPEDRLAPAALLIPSMIGYGGVNSKVVEWDTDTSWIATCPPDRVYFQAYAEIYPYITPHLIYLDLRCDSKFHCTN